MVHGGIVFCFFAAKGGVGCSVVAAASAIISARREPTLLVDLNGDSSTILGLDCQGRGLSDWFGSQSPPADSLRRLEVPVSERLSLLPTGQCRPAGTAERVRLLASLLATEGRCVMVDVGTSALSMVALLDAAEHSILVTRACYLALNRARCGPPPDEVVLVLEPGRALRSSDVGAALDAPVRTTVPWDPAVARAVDAGLLTSRLPRSILRLDSVLQR